MIQEVGHFLPIDFFHVKSSLWECKNIAWIDSCYIQQRDVIDGQMDRQR